MIPRLPTGFSHPMRIGSGAFASVYRVQQTALDRRVAIKFIYEKNGAERRELLKEAQTQAKLRAACVPQVYDAFEWRNSVCMVMEWVRGISLAKLLDAPLHEDQRIALAGQLVAALSEIHRLGFAHRDLKPDNILVTPDKGLYFIDFGFSKDLADATLSSVNTAKGTPAYMAPELWSQGGRADLIRADVFSAGKILTQILTGTAHALFAASACNVNPEVRPASGSELLRLWHEETKSALSDATKKTVPSVNIVAELTATALSAQLLSGAKQLIYAHRHDEAYWLLVESIEEDSNNQEALSQLAGFQDQAGKSRKKRHSIIIGAAMATVTTLAFLTGLFFRQTGQELKVSLATTTQMVSSKMLPFRAASAPQGTAKLRIDTLSGGSLSGQILLQHLPSNSTIIIDDDTIRHRANEYSIRLPSGNHDIIILDDHTKLYWQGTVDVLPFQKKAVFIE